METQTLVAVTELVPGQRFHESGRIVETLRVEESRNPNIVEVVYTVPGQRAIYRWEISRLRKVVLA